jgi:hypothetical protein
MNKFSIVVNIFAVVVDGLIMSTTNRGTIISKRKNLERYRVKNDLIHFISEKSTIKSTPRIPAKITAIISGLI